MTWECTGGDLEAGYLQTYPLGAGKEEEPLRPIVDMLLMTNLATRLGIPQPIELDLDWDSPEYLLWILWRCEALAPK